MSSVIATVEDAMMSACSAALVNPDKRSYVRTITTLPGGWTRDTLTRMLQGAPGVYIAYLGGAIKKECHEACNVGRFDAVIVNASARETDRRRGTQSQIGAYAMVERVVPAVHGLKIDNVGTLTVENINNLFNESTFDLGATVYAIQCTVPMCLPINTSDSDLDDFETFAADYDIPAFANTAEHHKWLNDDHATSQPDAADLVTLEKA